jgi:nucleotide-binding universal stress UspA family protein
MYRTILVPLDGSIVAEHALPLAVEIAHRAKATLHLVHVHVPVASAYSGIELTIDLSFDATVRENEQVYLERVLQQIVTASPVRVTYELLDGPVAAALCAQAVATGTDLIVMTTHGRGPLSRFWLGSIADKLVRQEPMPVLLLRPREETPDLACKPSLQHVLIPLDGSELAEEILESAIALGSLMQAHYTLLHVLEPIILPDRRFAGNAVGGFDSDLLKTLQDEAQAYLDRMAGRLRARSLQVQTRLITNRTAAPAILDEVREHPTDLIALATNGRGGLARLLLGSVADKVVRGSAVPVLVYRPPGK